MDNTANKNSTFKTIQFIYLSFMFAVVSFSVVAYFLIENQIFTIDNSDIFTIVVPIVAISSIFLSNWLYQKTVCKSTKTDDLRSKLATYQTATIIKGAILESAALLATVATFVSGNVAFLIVTFIVVIIMYVKFPKKEKFKEEVKLSFEEKSEFDKM